MFRAVVASAMCAALLLAACGSPATPAPPSTTPAPPTPTATPSPPPLPSGWVRLTLDDPPLAMGFPTGWTALSIAATEQQLRGMMKNLTGDAAVVAQWELDRLTSGRIRFSAAGPARMAGVAISLTIDVDSNDVSVAAAADRVVRDMSQHHAGDLVGRTDESLPLGPAVRLLFNQNVGGGSVPAQSLAYVVRLADGRTLTMSSTSIIQDIGFQDLLRQILSTFSLTT